MAGEVRPGDANMLSGGASEGANQDKMIVVKKIELLTKDRNHVVRREANLTYGVYVDGEHDPSNSKMKNIQKNMVVKDYDGKSLFRKAKEVYFVGVNTNPIPVVIPVTMVLGNEESIDGTLAIDFKCDPNRIANLTSLLGTDYSSTSAYGEERYTYITANNLSKMFRDKIADAGVGTMSQFDSTFNVIEKIRSLLYDAFQRDSSFHESGLLISRASARFSQVQAERIRALRSEGRIKMEESRMKFDNRMLEIELAKKEYDFINEG